MACPICDKKLETKQINLDTAILLCPDLKCPYPVGSECIQFQRKLDEIENDQDMMSPGQKSERDINKTSSSVSNFSNVHKEANDVSIMLTKEIEKLSQNSQTEYNNEFDVMGFINDSNNCEYGGNNESIDTNSVDLNFDMADLLDFL